MEITSDQERAVIMDAVDLLKKRVDKRSGGNSQSVDEWLKSIHLENYAETFKKNLYTDMERVRCVWEVELATVLEIQKPAHRKRILASVSGSSARAQNRNCTGPNLEDLNKDLNTLVSETACSVWIRIGMLPADDSYGIDNGEERRGVCKNRRNIWTVDVELNLDFDIFSFVCSSCVRRWRFSMEFWGVLRIKEFL